MHPEMDPLARTFENESLASPLSDTFATAPPASCEQPVAAPSVAGPSIPSAPDTLRDVSSLAAGSELASEVAPECCGAGIPESGAPLLTDWFDRPSPLPEPIEDIELPVATRSPARWKLLAAACAVVGAGAMTAGLSSSPAASVAPVVVAKVATTSASVATPSASASVSAPASAWTSAASASAPAASASAPPAKSGEARRAAPAPKAAPRVRPVRGTAETAAPAPKGRSLYGRD